MITLRKAALEDIPSLQQLYVDTISNSCGNDYDEEQLAVWKSSIKNGERWRQAVESQYFLVAELAGQIAGFGSLKEGEYVDFMYTHHLFQRCGIADAIFAALEQEAERQNKDRLYADVSKTARPFFERKGFKVLKENDNLIKGVHITNYRMEKLR
ncbi:GNAT family N-acetyltransferase [Pedobacter sp. SYSU D00535]|uniref:GNAT family N-acetyltransferase n=1 Tax=Pedobacter sp. SYSU D00535 TaxID=2810308 RepID=UPI001A977895|nr:GNAT family N-acetyltransferase [Pedobacter sp. SYSU D00535]